MTIASGTQRSQRPTKPHRIETRSSLLCLLVMCESQRPTKPHRIETRRTDGAFPAPLGRSALQNRIGLKPGWG